MATDAGTSSQSSTTRKVLVRVGANSRVVTLESDADVNAAIVGAFSDVPRVRDASSFIIQMKNVEWDEFIDLAEGQAIPVCMVHVRALQRLTWYVLPVDEINRFPLKCQRVTRSISVVTVGNNINRKLKSRSYG